MLLFLLQQHTAGFIAQGEHTVFHWRLNAKTHGKLLGHRLWAKGLRNRVAHAAFTYNGNSLALGSGVLLLQILRRLFAGICGLLGNVIDKVVNVQNIAAGEYAFNARLQIVGDNGPGGNGADGRARFAAELIFRDQPAGEQKRVTFVKRFRSGNGAAVFVHFCDDDTGYTLAPFDFHHCMT